MFREQWAKVEAGGVVVTRMIVVLVGLSSDVAAVGSVHGRRCRTVIGPRWMSSGDWCAELAVGSLMMWLRCSSLSSTVYIITIILL